jgi:hypothetical protein
VALAETWETLPVGAKVRVFTVTGTSITGRIKDVTATHITVGAGGIHRDSVQRIDRLTGQRAKGAGKGLLIGAALGGATGVLGGQSADRQLMASVNALRFGALGAVIGMGISRPKVETIYRRIPLAEALR